MSEEQLKAFLKAVQSDPELLGRLKAAADAEAVVELAKAAGFELSIDEVKKTQAQLSDQDLESVAGGCRANSCGPDSWCGAGSQSETNEPAGCAYC